MPVIHRWSIGTNQSGYPRLVGHYDQPKALLLKKPQGLPDSGQKADRGRIGKIACILVNCPVPVQEDRWCTVHLVK